MCGTHAPRIGDLFCGSLSPGYRLRTINAKIFVKLLSVLGLGFGQAMYALDAADGETESGFAVRHWSFLQVTFLICSSPLDRQPPPSRASRVSI